MIAADIVSSTPHTSPGMPTGRVVVIHATRSGIPGNPNEFMGTLNWFKNPVSQASSHWVIARDGLAARVVGDKWLAWHAGMHNGQAWGIELESAVEDDGYTQPQLDKLVQVCAGYIEDFGVEPIHSLDMARSGFIGHQETPQGRTAGKSDPGRKFPWAWVITALQQATEPPTEPAPPAPPLPTWPNETELRRLYAALFSTLVLDYRVIHLRDDPRGWEVVEVVNPDGSSCDPRIEIAIRS